MTRCEGNVVSELAGRPALALAQGESRVAKCGNRDRRWALSEIARKTPLAGLWQLGCRIR